MLKIKCIIGRAIHRTNFDVREINALTDSEKNTALQYLKKYVITDDRDAERVNNLITYLESGVIVEDIDMTVDIDFGSVILLDWENRKDRYTVLNNLSKFCTVIAYTHIDDPYLEGLKVQGLFDVVKVDSSVEQAVDYRIYADIAKLKTKGINKIVVVSADQGYKRFCDAIEIDCILVTGANLLRVKSPKINDFRGIIKEGFNGNNVAEVSTERLFDLIDSGTFSEELDAMREDFFDLQERYNALNESKILISKSLSDIKAHLDMFNSATSFDSAKAIISELPDGLVRDTTDKLLNFKTDVVVDSLEIECTEEDLSRLIQGGIGSITRSKKNYSSQDYSSSEWDDLSTDPVLDSTDYYYKPLDSDNYRDFIEIDRELNRILSPNVNFTIFGYIRRLSTLELDELRLMCKEVGLDYDEEDSKYELAVNLNYHPTKSRNRHYRRAGLKPPHNI